MGRILATTNLPSSKFTFPANFGTIPANKDFTITMAINNMVTGNFVNAQANYYAAPCQVNAGGTVIGHSHVVVQKMDSLTQATPPDPNVFAFFKGLNLAAVNGVLSADVTGGLAAGVYRLASINTCSNHQPVLGSVAQHGHFDDMIYVSLEFVVLCGMHRSLCVLHAVHRSVGQVASVIVRDLLNSPFCYLLNLSSVMCNASRPRRWSFIMNVLFEFMGMGLDMDSPLSRER